MMKELTNARFAASVAPLDARYHAQITDPEELALVLRVGARDDTATITIGNNDTGELAAYAVIGRDDDNMVVIYAARTWLRGMAAMALKGLFGSAQVINAPLRVHLKKLQHLQAYAKMFGAGTALEGLDGDGLPMGIFDGQ